MNGVFRDKNTGLFIATGVLTDDNTLQFIENSKLQEIPIKIKEPCLPGEILAVGNINTDGVFNGEIKSYPPMAPYIGTPSVLFKAYTKERKTKVLSTALNNNTNYGVIALGPPILSEWQFGIGVGGQIQLHLLKKGLRTATLALPTYDPTLEGVFIVQLNNATITADGVFHARAIQLESTKERSSINKQTQQMVEMLLEEDPEPTF